MERHASRTDDHGDARNLGHAECAKVRDRAVPIFPRYESSRGFYLNSIKLYHFFTHLLVLQTNSRNLPGLAPEVRSPPTAISSKPSAPASCLS